jgi:MFS transporter, DHA1 family, tetracycline resistance protein
MTKLKSIDRRLLTILLIVFVQMVGAAMIMPILPLYAQSEFNMSPRIITLLGTAFFAAQFIAGPFLGRLSDKYGRVPILIISQIGTAVSFFMLGAAGSVAILFFARILDGITGGNIIVAQAYITDITPREKRTESLGYVFAVFGLGFIIGPALGATLAAIFGPRMPYFMAAAAAVVVVLMTWFTLDETVSAEQRMANRSARAQKMSVGTIARNSSLLLILLVAFVGQFGMGLLQATFSLYGEAVLFKGYTEQMATVGVGVMLTIVGIGQVVTQTTLLPRALKNFDEAWLVVIGLVIRTTGLLGFTFFATPLVGAVASLFFAMGIGLMMPPLQSLSTTAVSDELRGGVLGVYQSTISLSTIASTAIAGTIFLINPTFPFLIGALLSLIVVVPALFLVKQTHAGRRYPKKETAVTPSN